MEKKLSEKLQEVCKGWESQPIGLMFQDEARFGRINDVRQCWAPKPIRPLCKAMLTHEYTYAYAAVEPATGTMDALILPQVNTYCMQIFLDTVAARHPGERIVMVMDGAGWHSSKHLIAPPNMRLLPLPPYAPELNPVEIRGTPHFPVTASSAKIGLCESQSETFERGSPISEITRVGVDLAKSVIQVHAVDAGGKLVTNRQLSRDKFLPWCAQLPPGCLVAMEACGGAHHWARKLIALGLNAKIIAAHLVAPYRLQGKGGKNDANDAAAVCEAASRPNMRFVPVKTTVQQGILCVHSLREGLKEERTASINRIRGMLTEFGLVASKSPEKLREKLTDMLEDASNDLSGLARLVVQEAYNQWKDLDKRIEWCDERISAHVKDDAQAKAAKELMGVGPVTASALVATVGDFNQFKNGAQFGAWLGLTPRQNSSGGKTNLGGITKRGDMYLRMLLIQGGKSAVVSAHKRSDPISKWLCELREKSGWQKAAVAMANKNARILWAIMTKGCRFDPRHVSVKPAGPATAMA